ncbi:MAG: YggT family protein [Candidatus Dormibacteraeota bacterium]|nr:YggT family protein [Candidatus Dormibacteraeota bacterium]
MERRDTEIVRDDVTGTVRAESRVTTADPLVPAAADTAEVVSRVSPGRRAIELTYLVFGLIEGLLAIRLVLKLLGANPQAGFTSFIYGLTDFFMAPFRNLLPTVGTGSSSSAVLETSVVIAIIVYALIAWVLARLIVILFFRNVTVSHRSSRGIGGPRAD